MAMDGQLISTLMAITALITVLAMPDGGRQRPHRTRVDDRVVG
jgi:hypothetical protein